MQSDLAETVLGFAHQTITDDTLQPGIGRAITVDPGAGATARLVGDLGRHACTTSVRIDAAPGDVFPYLTDAALIVWWMGEWADRTRV